MDASAIREGGAKKREGKSSLKKNTSKKGLKNFGSDLCPKIWVCVRAVLWDWELWGLILGLVGEKVGRKMSRNFGFGTEMRPKCLDLILGDLRGFSRWVGCWYGLGRHCGSGGAEIGAGVGLVKKKGGYLLSNLPLSTTKVMTPLQIYWFGFGIFENKC